MGVRATFLRHPALRWVVPVAVVGGMSLAAAGVFSAQASTNLPPRTAAQLLADIENAKVNGLSGTIVANADLGLPSLPEIGGSGSGNNLMDLLSGSHTARVWYAGPTKQRIALLDAVGETDVFHNGTDVWQWSSADKLASHSTLPNGGENLFQHPSSALTPQQLANQALAAIDPSTVVTTDENRRVADRAAYELVLTPRDTTSRVGSVHIAVDGQYKIPLERASLRPRRHVLTCVGRFVHPTELHRAERLAVLVHPAFRRTRPAVHRAPTTKTHRDKTLPSATSHSGTTTIGKGWTTVVETKLGSDGTAAQQAQQTLGGLTRVSGTWGSGYLFNSKLVTGLLTDDGRLFAGTVDPQVLYAAARK